MEPQADLKEIYTTVRRHLLTQGCKSHTVDDIIGRMCKYRGPGGTMCAVGVLIPDNNYDEAIEGARADSTWVLQCLPFCTDDPSVIDFLGKLQYIHDDVPVEEWPVKLEELADEYDIHTQ